MYIEYLYTSAQSQVNISLINALLLSAWTCTVALKHIVITVPSCEHFSLRALRQVRRRHQRRAQNKSRGQLSIEKRGVGKEILDSDMPNEGVFHSFVAMPCLASAEK